MQKKEGFILFGIVPIVGFMGDFITKYFVITKLCITESTVEVLSFFNLVCVLNTGVSFGMFSGMPNGKFFLLAVTITILTFIHFLLYKERVLKVKYGYSLIIAGAYGNIIDRIINGGVVDFLDFHIKNLHYPAFNVADSLVFVGVCIVIFYGRGITGNK